MYDKYCHILDYNDPLKVIDLIHESIANDVADINDYMCLYSLYSHTLQYQKAIDLRSVITSKFPNLTEVDNLFMLKHFEGDYPKLWEVYFKKKNKIYLEELHRDLLVLEKFNNVNQPTTLDDVDNVFLYKQGGTGDEIIFFRWYKELKSKIKGNIYYLSNGILEPTYKRVFSGFNSIQFNPKKQYSLLSIFKLPKLLNVGYNIPNQRYLFADPDLVKNYSEKNKFRIGLCHHGQYKSKLRGLLSIPRNYIVDQIGSRAEVVNLYYGENTYVKGKKTSVYKEPRNSDMLYPKLDNYEDLLAIIETCDVVISCDTSVAHAAGAMGKKTFVLCNGRLYFPWFIEGHVGKSRFYEDVTVVKQFEPANWKISVDKVVNELIQYK